MFKRVSAGFRGFQGVSEGRLRRSKEVRRSHRASEGLRRFRRAISRSMDVLCVRVGLMGDYKVIGMLQSDFGDSRGVSRISGAL